MAKSTRETMPAAGASVSSAEVPPTQDAFRLFLTTFYTSQGGKNHDEVQWVGE